MAYCFDYGMLANVGVLCNAYKFSPNIQYFHVWGLRFVCMCVCVFLLVL